MPRLRLLLPALSLALHVFLPPPAHAQGQTVETTGPDISVVVDGFLQGRASYLRVASATEEADAAERLGFGFRRIRLRFDVGIGDRLGLFFHFAGASGTVGVLDFFATYQATDRLRFRFGRMASAQPRAFILTPAPAIDAVDRAFIAERWGARTLSPDGRDFGVDVQLQGERGEVSLFLHNGDGSWSAGNVRGGLSSRDPLNGLDRTGLALSLYGAYRPPTLSGLEVGAFAGVNGAKNLITVRDAGSPGRTYTSYAAHLYWGADARQPARPRQSRRHRRSLRRPRKWRGRYFYAGSFAAGCRPGKPWRRGVRARRVLPGRRGGLCLRRQRSVLDGRGQPQPERLPRPCLRPRASYAGLLHHPPRRLGGRAAAPGDSSSPDRLLNPVCTLLGWVDARRARHLS